MLIIQMMLINLNAHHTNDSLFQQTSENCFSFSMFSIQKILILNTMKEDQMIYKGGVIEGFTSRYFPSSIHRSINIQAYRKEYKYVILISLNRHEVDTTVYVVINLCLHILHYMRTLSAHDLVAVYCVHREEYIRVC